MINSIAEIVGSGLGRSILRMLGAPDVAGMVGDATGMDIGALLGYVTSGGVGGAELLTIVGFVRSKMG